MTPATEQPLRIRGAFSEWLLVVLSFAIFASVRSPIPGVNEPHYLTKARHFWDPAWCSRDPFLQSADAHYVFYATVGACTQFLSLEQTAVVGRVLGWGLLAAGWCALARQLMPGRWGSLWSAWIFLGLAAIGNWSGEWVVGGIEAKVLSYGCVWLSMAAALAGQGKRSAAWAGAAVSFHPVVGIWNTTALIAMWLLDDWRIWRQLTRLHWRSGLACSLTWIACAAPGLVPAVVMLRGADRNQSYAADYIQVYYRLAHHLDPWMFSRNGYISYGLLLALSVMLYVKFEKSSAHWNQALRYVVAAVGIAAAGVAIRAVPEVALAIQQRNVFPAANGGLESWIRYKPQLAGLLKFYPFRLADVAVPWVASLLLAVAMQRWGTRRGDQPATATGLSTPTISILPWVIGGACFVLALCLPAPDRNPSRLPPREFAGWLDACRWIKQETPAEALCFAGNEGWALKWYGARAEYLSRKDCPQDAPGIIAWNDRFRFIAQWSRRHLKQGFSKAAIRELRQHTQIDYVIASKFGPFDIPPVYTNETYQVYRLRDADLQTTPRIP